MEKMLNIEKIKKAAKLLEPVVRKTDLLPTQSISSSNNIFLKTENLQVTGSFKVRGAYFKMAQLSDEEKASGVIACSAGNHAQGVALAAQKMEIKSTIFIPSIAPISKIEATRKMGAQIELIDGVYDDAYQAALKQVKTSKSVFIHPFNDYDVIAGQGTIALEILEQLPEIDAVVVPVGGGGLISGIAYCIKKLKPSCKVYGVQAERAPSMVVSIENKKIMHLDTVTTFADGIAVKSPQELTFAICQKYVDEIITVSEDEIATAILSLIEQQKLIAEGAGAVAVAAALFDKIPLRNKNIVCIVSGGNIDVNILSRVINRGLLTSGRLSDLTIHLFDRPGQLKDVADSIARLGANIIRVSHNRGLENTDINTCYLKITMETRDLKHLEMIKESLTKAGYKISDNTKAW